MPGSANDPVRLDLFQTIREVGWGSGHWGIVYVFISPANPFFPFFWNIIELTTPKFSTLLTNGDELLPALGFERDDAESEPPPIEEVVTPAMRRVYQAWRVAGRVAHFEEDASNGIGISVAIDLAAMRLTPNQPSVSLQVAITGTTSAFGEYNTTFLWFAAGSGIVRLPQQGDDLIGMPGELSGNPTEDSVQFYNPDVEGVDPWTLTYDFATRQVAITQ